MSHRPPRAQGGRAARSYEWAPIGLGALISVALLVALHDPGYTSNDGAQYIDVAHSLLKGEGASTRIAFYEKQHARGAFPIPQTVFPPGFSVLIAGGMAAGMSGPDAGLTVGILSHVGVAIVLFVLLRMCVGTGLLTWAVPLGWLFVAVSNELVLTVSSDVTFALFTMASIAAAGRWTSSGRASRRALVACGVLAGVAFAVRYTGMFYGATIGLYFGVRALSARRRAELLDALAVLVPAGLVAGSVLARNLLVAGELFGNPGVSRDPALMDVITSSARAVGQTLGISWGGVFRGAPPDVLLLLALIGGVLLLAWPAGEPRTEPAPGCSVCRRTILGLAGLYATVSIAALAYLSITRSSDLVTARYLLPLVPVVMLLGAVVARLRVHGRVFPRWRPLAAGLMLTAGFVGGQARTMVAQLERIRTDTTYEILETALVSAPGSREAMSRIAEEDGPDAVLLVPESQMASLLVDLPLVELTEERYATRPWTEERVRELVRTLGVSHVVGIPGLEADPTSASYRLEELLRDLSGGTLPDWLELDYESPVLRTYRVLPPRSAGAVP